MTFFHAVCVEEHFLNDMREGQFDNLPAKGRRLESVAQRIRCASAWRLLPKAEEPTPQHHHPVQPPPQKSEG